MEQQPLKETNPYEPGSSFVPFQPSSQNIDEIEKKVQEDLQKMADLSGPEILYFFYTRLMPDELSLQEAKINQFADTLNDLSNYSNFITMMNQEFNLSNPSQEGYTDYTNDLIRQLNQIVSAIDRDPLLQEGNKQNLLKPIQDMSDLLTSKSAPEIWEEASGSSPNEKDLKVMLSGFDQLMSISGMISQSTQSQLQYDVEAYKKDVNFLKTLVGTSTKAEETIIKRLKGSS